MYDVGFGDCFLLGFHDSGTTEWVLFDCGTITEKKSQLDAVVDDILLQSAGPDGVSRLSLVIATHRHKDHVWGFADARWSNVEVGEVWMPWTEDPSDAEATRIRERQSALALALAGAPSDANPLADDLPRRKAGSERSRAAAAMALNALSNERAMKTLHEGFIGTPPRKFLPEADQACQSRTAPRIDGVKFHVLGPPRNLKALAAMDPPEGAGYLRWPSRIPARRAGPPFAERYCIRHADYAPSAPGRTFTLVDRRACRKDISAPSGVLNAALDKAVNNTSLVIMIEAGGRYLLFTADAQWGSWQAILDEPACKALLEKTTMLKVGHHGSHNATPRTLIEELAPKPITALFSTKKVKQWPNIPRAPLLAAMAERGDHVARTDQPNSANPSDFTVIPDLCIEWSC